MRVRRATPRDFKELYKIGKSTPEFKVSDDGEFMLPEDFKFAIKNKQGIFLVAEISNKIVGFAYAVREAPTYGALVYVVVIPNYRKRGIASNLIARCENHLKKCGVKSIYGLISNPTARKVIKNLGYKRGKTLVWMNKEL